MTAMPAIAVIKVAAGMMAAMAVDTPAGVAVVLTEEAEAGAMAEAAGAMVDNLW
jgi:hypothetical protein